MKLQKNTNHSTLYGKIANHYDLFDSLNYGTSNKAREWFLDHIPKTIKNPLIIGCGTGVFAKKFIETNAPPRLTINDVSADMIEQTKVKISQLSWKGKLISANCDVRELPAVEKYDFISLNFFLNIFPIKERLDLLRVIASLTDHRGHFIITDFTRPTNPLFYPFYLLNWWAANIFFWITAGNKPNSLGNLAEQITLSGIKIVSKKKFLGGLYTAFLGRVAEQQIKDANIVSTDRCIQGIYRQAAPSLSTIMTDEKLGTINLTCGVDVIQSLAPLLQDHFYLIAGSSNFHHLDASNLIRLHKKLGKPVQLVLFDHHMDCQKYHLKTRQIHCGNWISYAYQNDLISRVVMVGTEDYRHLGDFDSSLVENGDLLYLPDMDKSLPKHFLSSVDRVYISVDTDILDVSSDWGIGRHSLQAVLEHPVWKDLKKYNLAGACILGHVTDNRRIWDLTKKYWRERKAFHFNFSAGEWWEYFKYGIFPKLWASLTARPLPLDEQLEIILAFYKKIEDLRKADTVA